MEIFDVRAEDKADLQRRFRIMGPLPHPTVKLPFWTYFDGRQIGDLAVNLRGKFITWDEFYPLGKSVLPHPELQHIGLGTLAHTLCVQKVKDLLEDPSRYWIRHLSPGPARIKQLSRMGNGPAIRHDMPFMEYRNNSIAACKAIGFDVEALR